MSAQLPSLGWDTRRQEELDALGDPALRPGRVVFASRGLYRVSDGEEEAPAVVAGSADLPAPPATGDWVAFRPPDGDGPRVIRALLPRRTQLSRRSAGGRKSPDAASGSQLLAANVDTAFIVTALDEDFSPRRIERYLALVWEGGATPVVLLNKADLCPDLASAVAEAEGAAPGAEVVALSALTGEGVDPLRCFLRPGRTVAFLGSSGVGKSTLVNRLLGEARQATGGIREWDGKGRHTTASRELILLPGGGMLLDTPGLREVGLEGVEEGLEAVFPEIAALAALCRFRDCTHSGEPGCAVEAAAAAGNISAERLGSWRRLSAESAFEAARGDEGAQRERKRKEKLLARTIKGYFKLKPGKK